MLTGEGREDKRQHPRFPVQFRSSFSSVNLVGGEGALTNLSVRGCRIESWTTVNPGTDLQLNLHLSDESLPLAITVAAVRWSHGGTFGVEFIDMNETEWNRLGRFIKQLESPEFPGRTCP